MTLGELRAALALIGAGHDHKPVVVWLPGSKIDLNSKLWLAGEMAPDGSGAVAIEGNVRPGSALSGILRDILRDDE